MSKAYICDECGQVKSPEQIWRRLTRYERVGRWAAGRPARVRGGGGHVCDDCLPPTIREQNTGESQDSVPKEGA